MAQRRILIVDDEALERMTLSRILELEGYEVQAVENGEMALAALWQRPFDLMILDLNMPGMNGMEVLIQTLDEFPGLQVIVLTAYGTLETVIEALRRKVHDYILKPARAEEIVASVQRAFEAEKAIAEKRAEYFAREEHVFRMADGTIVDTRKQIITWVNGYIILTPTEARFLAVLFRQFNQVVSYSDIVREIHGYQMGNEESATVLRPLVSRLRQKLSALPRQSNLVKTIRGAGYMVASD